MKSIKFGLVAVVSTVAGVANAAATDIVAQVTAAQTDALAVAGALTTLSVAVWGANYLRRKFFGR